MGLNLDTWESGGSECCPICGIPVLYGQWHYRADGVYASARSTHKKYHEKKGEWNK